MKPDIQQHRAKFFTDGIFFQFLAIILQGLLIFLSVLVYFRAEDHRSNRLYFEADDSGSVFKAIPLDSPLGLTRLDITFNTVMNIQSVFQFGFVDTLQTIQNRSNLFTGRGWDKFRRLLVDQNLVVPVIDNRLLLSSVPADVPSIAFSGLVNNVYSWQVVVPIQLNFSGRQSFIQGKRLNLVVQVIRTAVTSDTPDGIIIDNIEVLN